ncbi:MAG: gliding motility-associated C-terminal domain-containing protein [Chitinophagaceae bacterium]|nr:gliding motility-associated C-terminal domain-containing protein [Chitinophagaceae bacterium]
MKPLYSIFKTTIVSCLFFTSTNLFGQCDNLVPNGSFETFSALPNDDCDWNLAVGWNNAATSANCNTTNGTPDYYHLLGQGQYSSLPSNYFAVVNPLDGSAVMGLAGTIDLVPAFREYIAISLTSPLVVGQSYTMSYSITAGTPNVGGLYVDGWGASLSVGPILQSAGTSNVIPITNLDYIVPGVFSSAQWQTFTFTFVADQPYSYFTFGNFYSQANQTSVSYGTQGFINAAYIFLDAVSIIPISTVPLAVDVPDFNICQGQSVVVTAQVTGGLEPYTYTWNPNITSTTNPITLSPTQTSVYTVVVTDCNGDTASASFDVVVSVINTTDVQTACNSFTWIDGITYTASTNTPSFTLTSAAGCDSVVTLNLTISNVINTTDVQTACNSFTWIDGITYTASTNTPSFTLTSAGGCDSVVTLNLTISNVINTTDVQTACSSFTWIDGITYTTSTNTPIFTLTSAAGCDSVVTLNLTISNVINTTDVQTACNSFTWIDGITYTASTDTPSFTLTSAAGCDSVVSLNLTINNVINTTDVQTACNSFTWIDGITYTASTNTPSFTLTSAAGCDSVVSLNLTIFEGDPPLPSFDVIAQLCIGDSVLIGPTDGITDSIVWSDGFSGTPRYVSEPGEYTISFIGVCENRTISIFVEEQSCEDCVAYIPNAFTPNADGSNDVFFPITQCAFEEYDLVIFNRWGKLVYKSTNQNEKWDGKHNGVDCEIEVYTYLLTYKMESQIKKQKKGVVTLIR